MKQTADITAAEIVNQATVVKLAVNQDQAAVKALEKELKEFSGGLAYDQARVIERTQDGFTMGVEGFYRAGLGLILIERHEGVQTYALILEQYFPGVSRRAAFNYMQFARAASKLPNFKQFCLERGGYSKGLTMLQACSEAEIQEFEESGELRGFTQEDIANMSVRTMQRALLKAKEKLVAAVKKATEKTEGENAELTEKVAALEAALKPAELAGAVKIFGQITKNLNAAANFARRLDTKLLAADWNTRFRCLAQLHQLEMMVGQIQSSIMDMEEPEPPQREEEGS